MPETRTINGRVYVVRRCAACAREFLTPVRKVAPAHCSRACAVATRDLAPVEIERRYRRALAVVRRRRASLDATRGLGSWGWG